MSTPFDTPARNTRRRTKVDDILGRLMIGEKRNDNVEGKKGYIEKEDNAKEDNAKEDNAKEDVEKEDVDSFVDGVIGGGPISSAEVKVDDPSMVWLVQPKVTVNPSDMVLDAGVPPDINLASDIPAILATSSIPYHPPNHLQNEGPTTTPTISSTSTLSQPPSITRRPAAATSNPLAAFANVLAAVTQRIPLANPQVVNPPVNPQVAVSTTASAVNFNINSLTPTTKAQLRTEPVPMYVKLDGYATRKGGEDTEIGSIEEGRKELYDKTEGEEVPWQSKGFAPSPRSKQALAKAQLGFSRNLIFVNEQTIGPAETGADPARRAKELGMQEERRMHQERRRENARKEAEQREKESEEKLNLMKERMRKRKEEAAGHAS